MFIVMTVYGHITFVVVFANDLYSVSIDDLAIVSCLQIAHEMMFYPKKIENPSVILVSSNHPTQYASE